MRTALLVVLTAFAVQLSPVDPEFRGSIRGTVKVSESGVGIAGVNIVLSLQNPVPGNPAIQRNATTDSAGRFEFQNLTGGSFGLRAQREGYFGPTVRGTRSTSANASGVLNRETPVLDVALTMVRGAAISGRVLNADGNPVQGLTLFPMQLRYQSGHASLVDVVGGAPLTDDRGEYRMFWLAPGEYYFRAASARASGGQTSELGPYYFPGTPAPGQAQSIIVREGQEVSGVDFRLPPGNRVTLSGKIVNRVPGGRLVRNGQTARGVSSVILVRQSPGVRDGSQTMISNAGTDLTLEEGPFILRGVTPGTYDLFPVFNDGERYHTGQTRIEVSDRDVGGIVATIRPSAVLTGRIVLKGAAQNVQLSTIGLQLRPELPIPLVRSPAYASPDATGAFAFTASAAGEYKVIVNPPAGWYVADIRHGANNVYNSALIELDGPPSAPLEITLSADAGSIRGASAPGSFITLIPEAPRRGNPSLYRTVTTNPAGQFTVNRIAPGAYKLFAWKDLPLNAEENADFLAKYITKGRAITINAGEVLPNIQLDVIPQD